MDDIVHCVIAIGCLVALSLTGGAAAADFTGGDAVAAGIGTQTQTVESGVAAPFGTAQPGSDNLTVKRTGLNTLEIAVDKSEFPADTNESTANIRIEVGGISLSEDNTIGNSDSTFNFSIAIERFGESRERLVSANLTVIPQPNGRELTAQENLRQLKFASDVESFSNGTIEWRMQPPVGFASPMPAVETDLNQGGQRGRIDGALVRKSPNSWAFRLNISDIPPDIDLFAGPLTVVPFPNSSPRIAGETTVDVPAVANNSAQPRVQGDQVLVSHPLFRDGREVSVDIETTDPSGDYPATTEVTNGNVAIPRNPFQAGTTDVTISQNGHELVDSLSLRSVQRANGTISGDTINVTDEELFSDLEIERLWVQTNSVVFLRGSDSFSVSGSTLTLKDRSSESSIQSVFVVGQQDDLWIEIVDGEQTSQTTQTPSGTGKQTDTTTKTSESSGGEDDDDDEQEVTQLNNIEMGFVGLGIGLVCTFFLLTLSAGKGPAGKVIYGGGAFGLFLVLFGTGKFFGILLNGDSILGDAVAVFGYIAPLVVGIVAVTMLKPNGSSTAKKGAAGSGSGMGYPTSHRKDSGAGAATPIPTYELAVQLWDSKADSRVQEEVTLTIDSKKTGRETRTVRNGTTTYEGTRGEQVTFKATWRGQTVSTTKQIRGNESVTLAFEPYDLVVTVTDADTGDTIDGATVELSYQNKSGQKSTEGGDCDFEVSLHAKSVGVTVDAPKYRSKQRQISPSSDTDLTVSLDPQRGTLEGRVSLDGEKPADVPVVVTPRDARSAETEREAKTDATGAISVPDLRVGEYELRVDLPPGADCFDTRPVTARVRDSQTTSERLAIDFDFSLGSAHRRRLDDIRQDLDGIGSVARRDTVIPRFYASVVEAYLDQVQELESAGIALLEHNRDPATTADAMLDAAEAATRTIDDVMSSKRNVDLFTACSDLPDQSVAWNGQFDLEDLFDLAAIPEWKGPHLGQFDDRKTEVERTIDAERGDLAEVSPAQEMISGLEEMSMQERTDPLRSAAYLVLMEGLLDAVERLFERSTLRERMTQTVI